MTGSVFSLRELSADLQNIDFQFKNLGKTTGFLVKHYTQTLFQVAIESWPEWDLNPRPLNSTRTQSQLCTATPISSLVQRHI